MSQVDIVPTRLAAKLRIVEKEAIAASKHDDSPGGKHQTTGEMTHIRGIRTTRLEMERYASAVEFGVTVLRTGLDSRSTRRHARDHFEEVIDFGEMERNEL